MTFASYVSIGVCLLAAITTVEACSFKSSETSTSGKIYYYYQAGTNSCLGKNHADANAFCKSVGGQKPAIIKSAADQEVVTELMINYGGNSQSGWAWMGLKDLTCDSPTCNTNELSGTWYTAGADVPYNWVNDYENWEYETEITGKGQPQGHNNYDCGQVFNLARPVQSAMPPLVARAAVLNGKAVGRWDDYICSVEQSWLCESANDIPDPFSVE